MSSIVIALPKLEDAKRIRDILLRHGLETAAVCTTGAQALREAGQLQAGILISHYRLADMYYTELAECLPEYFDLLLLGPSEVVVNSAEGIMALSYPFRPYDLVNTAGMMFSQLERRLKKKKATAKKRSEKEENYIRNAKMLLMERNHMEEAEAYRYIQKCSMDSGTNMAETAQMILMLVFDE